MCGQGLEFIRCGDERQAGNISNRSRNLFIKAGFGVQPGADSRAALGERIEIGRTPSIRLIPCSTCQT